MNCMNKKIENALADINIVKIMNRASRRFKNQLDKDTIYSCHINALWRAFENYDESKGAKFTTYLYNGVFIECMKEIKFFLKSKNNTGKLHDNIPEKNNQYIMTDILDELNDIDKNLFLDRLSNMTISEIGEKHGLNRETARRKINKIMSKIKKNFF